MIDHSSVKSIILCFSVHVLCAFLCAQVDDESAREDSYRGEEVRLRLLRQNVCMPQQSYCSYEVSLMFSVYIHTYTWCRGAETLKIIKIKISTERSPYRVQ